MNLATPTESSASEGNRSAISESELHLWKTTTTSYHVQTAEMFASLSRLLVAVCMGTTGSSSRSTITIPNMVALERNLRKLLLTMHDDLLTQTKIIVTLKTLCTQEFEICQIKHNYYIVMLCANNKQQ